jgi:hypothetical protein
MAKTRLADLSSRQRSAFGLGAVLQVILLVAALVDIRRRPQDQIKGSKRLWTAGAFVTFVGPISYFVFGRKR